MQQCNPIRVGWQLEFMTPDTVKSEIVTLYHWADAGFISVLRGEVFAQIESIYQQGPSLDKNPAIFLVNGEPHGWVSIISTTGVMRQKFKKMTGVSEDMLKKLETSRVKTRWAVMLGN